MSILSSGMAWTKNYIGSSPTPKIHSQSYGSVQGPKAPIKSSRKWKRNPRAWRKSATSWPTALSTTAATWFPTVSFRRNRVMSEYLFPILYNNIHNVKQNVRSSSLHLCCQVSRHRILHHNINNQRHPNRSKQMYKWTTSTVHNLHR